MNSMPLSVFLFDLQLHRNKQFISQTFINLFDGYSIFWPVHRWSRKMLIYAVFLGAVNDFRFVPRRHLVVHRRETRPLDGESSSNFVFYYSARTSHTDSMTVTTRWRTDDQYNNRFDKMIITRRLVEAISAHAPNNCASGERQTTAAHVLTMRRTHDG